MLRLTTILVVVVAVAAAQAHLAAARAGPRRRSWHPLLSAGFQRSSGPRRAPPFQLAPKQTVVYDDNEESDDTIDFDDLDVTIGNLDPRVMERPTSGLERDLPKSQSVSSAKMAERSELLRLLESVRNRLPPQQRNRIRFGFF